MVEADEAIVFAVDIVDETGVTLNVIKEMVNEAEEIDDAAEVEEIEELTDATIDDTAEEICNEMTELAEE